MAALAAAGLSRGCGFVDGAGPVFCPDRPLSRAELAAFLHRLDRFAASLIGPDSSTDGQYLHLVGTARIRRMTTRVWSTPATLGADGSAGPDDDALTFEGSALPCRSLSQVWGFYVC